jgi:NAD(P)-dependent dehydrogenase (short-subunit alcohol dehydrogenase family)
MVDDSRAAGSDSRPRSARRAPRGRVVLVTGAARGLGRATAELLAARGERVHVVWRSSERRARELERAFPGRVQRADLTDARECERVVGTILRLDGRLDALAHAVGDYVSGPLAELHLPDLERLWRSNVVSALELFRAARASLRASKGAVVLFGCAGLGGLAGKRECAAYAAVKSALVVLARSLALEEAAHGVRVNVLSPGIVPHAGAHPDTHDRERHARIPLGRPTRPEEVARAAAWLLSNEAGHVTGADLPVSGGWRV